MPSYEKIDSSELFFVADCHFRNPDLDGERVRREEFARFVAAIPGDASLFLMGDIFDFYFEWGSVTLKNCFDIFHSLRMCRERGASLHFLGGNHDFWGREFMEREVGIRVHRGDDIFVEAQGRRLCLTHGDLILSGDTNYRRVRQIIRHPAVIAVTRKVVHPDLMDAIATRVSNTSRKRKRPSNESVARQLGEDAERRFFDKDNDVFIMGHVHHPLHRSFDHKDFVILGDWIKDFTYAKLADGHISLECWNRTT